MKIICTEEEKENLMEVMELSSICPFDFYNDGAMCKKYDSHCWKCMSNNIEWDITDKKKVEK